MTSDKRTAILEAMLNLVVERGFHAAPMSTLAKKSGASAGVIYHYFPSKEDIIHALYAKVKSEKRHFMLKGYSQDLDPNDISIFTAVREQLGLRLEAKTGPVDVLVVDQGNKTPTEN